MKDEGEARVVGVPQLLGGLIKLALLALVILTPVLGVWVASSIAAHQNGSIGIAIVGGALLFPVGPLLWEVWTSGRARKRQSRFLDRLILRTLFLNLMFLGVLLGTRPQLGFVAISTRGDWFLDGRSGSEVETARGVVFATAARLEWLYLAFHRNPYRAPPQKKTADQPKPPPVVEAHPPHAPPGDASAPRWPQPATLHPLVASIPASAEGSIGSVGYYFAEHERDPIQRIKALHDYVADRIAYDVPALSLSSIPQEDADPEDVFRNRRGVCSGYAQLLVALGRVTGDDIIYVVGDARVDSKDDQGGAGHAWNAVRIAGKWYLIDATWNAGSLVDHGFSKRYRSDYLFTPPEVFGLDHYPEEDKWQLRDRPLSRGEFMRQPMMSARFYAEGFELLAPDRSQVTVDARLEAQVRNRSGRFLMADFVPKLGGGSQPCAVEGDTIFSIRCEPPHSGEYQVRLFSAGARFGTYWSVGRIDVNRR